MKKYRILIRYNKMAVLDFVNSSKVPNMFISVILEKFLRKKWMYVMSCSFVANPKVRQEVDVLIECIKNKSVSLLNMKHPNEQIRDLCLERIQRDLESIIQCKVIEIKDKRQY